MLLERSAGERNQSIDDSRSGQKYRQLACSQQEARENDSLLRSEYSDSSYMRILPVEMIRDDSNL